ncbi:Hint domain-containing protein [Defluviimonas sp. SAOS-178_SWC]|uniref:Hint domain-containing protein n=1 Tax=Defluviimonas sp. SAOS-178_SWC TaxID=3121287 RepID=UPI003221BD2C
MATRSEPGRRPPRQEPIRWTLPGFCGSARVTTSFGDLPIQALRRRDPLRTVQGTLATVDWIDCIQLEEDFLHANPDALPVRISAGALGNGRPERDVIVSPHQVVNVAPGQFQQDFRRARDLTDKPGIMRQPEMLISYYVFHCAAPAAVMVEGLCVSVSP